MTSIKVPFATLAGRSVTLTAWLASDGAVQHWTPSCPDTGDHVALDALDKWLAVAAMTARARAAVMT